MATTVMHDQELNERVKRYANSTWKTAAEQRAAWLSLVEYANTLGPSAGEPRAPEATTTHRDSEEPTDTGREPVDRRSGEGEAMQKPTVGEEAPGDASEATRVPAEG